MEAGWQDKDKMAFYDTDHIHNYYQARIKQLREALVAVAKQGDLFSIATDALKDDDALARKGY